MNTDALLAALALLDSTASELAAARAAYEAAPSSDTLAAWDRAIDAYEAATAGLKAA